MMNDISENNIAENNNINYKEKKKKKKLKVIAHQELMKLNNVNIYLYIKNLHKHIQKQERKIVLLKRKVRSFNFITNVQKKESNLDNEKGDERATETNKINEHETEIETESAAKFLDDIKRAAEDVQNLTGFVYEPTSGMYYDSQTGYYYNAELGLYYDGKIGCYYKYDQEKNQFDFHSQVYDQREIDEYNKKVDDKHNSELNIILNEFSHLDINNLRDNALDIAKKYPPSLRIIVQETNLPKIKTGALFIVTYKGGSLGREGDHDVIIPDINVSKCHLKFLYNEDKSVYQIQDMGSRNGTLLNSTLISEHQKESKKMDLIHGSIIIISQTKLLCHIHDGYTTCGQCEPGLLVSTSPTQTVQTQPTSHKNELKRIQKKYGLETEKFIEPKNPTDYNDRAGRRRTEVGSSSQHEKTETASLDASISTQNKGFKLLSKLGWTEGQSLGKNDKGILEPIPIQSNEGTKGLGCNDIVIPFNKKNEHKKKLWKKTQERYKNLPVSDIFQESDDEL